MNIEYLQNGTIVTNTTNIVKALYTTINSNKNEKKFNWKQHKTNMSYTHNEDEQKHLKTCKTHNDCEQSQIEAYNDIEQNQIQELQDRKQLWTK